MQKKADYLGSKIDYVDVGQGPSVVFIHGFAEDGRIWKNISERLPNYRLIIPHLPGSGTSPAVNGLSIESMGDAVMRVLDQERITNAVIIGHSMGGYVTLAMVEKYPGRITAFGLFHSTAYPDTEEKKTSRKKNIKFIETHGSHEFLKQSTPALFGESFKKKHPQIVEEVIEDYKDFNPRALVSYLEAMMNRPDRTSVLINCSKPVLFIIGTDDNAIPFADSMKLCHLPSLSYIHILDNTGHMGMLEAPDRCIEILENFLKDVTVSPNIDG
jgi:pimeloyl-ACP methyl ester carboxylesterase